MMLGRADTISATIVALEPGRCARDADRGSEARRGRNSSAAARPWRRGHARGRPDGRARRADAGGADPGAGGDRRRIRVARQYRPALARIQLGLERALDQLEHDGAQPDRRLPRRPPGLLGMLADEIRRSLR